MLIFCYISIWSFVCFSFLLAILFKMVFKFIQQIRHAHHYSMNHISISICKRENKNDNFIPITWMCRFNYSNSMLVKQIFYWTEIFRECFTMEFFLFKYFCKSNNWVAFFRISCINCVWEWLFLNPIQTLLNRSSWNFLFQLKIKLIAYFM